MSSYLLDTHILVWMRQNDERLSRAKWEPIFYAGDHRIHFSLVSIWEIAIKRALGKLNVEGNLADFARSLETDHGFHKLPIGVTDICRLEKLPLHHRDPFDRLLIAQAIENGATAITNDPKWQPYPVKVDF